MEIIIIAILITMITSMITAYYYSKPTNSKRVFYKAIASTGFVFIGIFAVIENVNVNIIYAFGILLGLVLGLMGDMLLSMHPFLNKREAEIFNLAGVIAFSLGHILYIAVFIYFTGFVLFSLVYTLIIPVIVMLLIQFNVIKAGKMCLTIVLYSCIISLMLVQGSYVHYRASMDHSLFILIAALLFVASDIILMVYNFTKYRRRIMMSVCLIMYYSAQILFAYSILLFNN